MTTTMAEPFADPLEEGEKSLEVAQDEPIIDYKAERALVWRLDLIFLSVGFLGYVFKYLDQTNINNAYVSGMKTELNLQGNELNLFTTFFNVGYIIMLFPTSIIVSRFGPGKWLPGCELIWGILTCTLSLAKNAQTIYGIRFLIGFFEATAWPGYNTLISAWYLPDELSLRFTIYNCAQPVGAMLSGALQGSISTNLSGHFGRSGWQWAFIVNGVCTIAVALLSFFALPGFPDRPNRLSRWYLRDQDLAAAAARNARVKRANVPNITPKSFLRSFKFWQLWAFAFAWPLGMNVTPSGFFNLYLEGVRTASGTPKYSVAQLNYIPIGGQAIAIVSQLAFSYYSDKTGKRLRPLLVHSAIAIVSLGILTAKPSNVGLQMAGYYLNFVGNCAMTMLCAWAANHLQNEPVVRTVLFSAGTVVTYVINMWLPLVAYPASQAPDWKVGASVYLALQVATTFLFVAIHYLFQRDKRIAVEKSLKEIQ